MVAMSTPTHVLRFRYSTSTLPPAIAYHKEYLASFPGSVQLSVSWECLGTSLIRTCVFDFEQLDE